MSYQYLAFFMGLFGSLHCVAMCGPLVLALPTHSNSPGRLFLNRLLYQVGRILMYAGIGLILGLLGNSIAIKGWQQALTLFTGILFLFMAFFHWFQPKVSGLLALQQRILQPVLKSIGQWLYRPGGSFIAGALNGLLPCGMVYMALAAALNADSVWGASSFMVFFGLGTLPLMLGVALFGGLIRQKLRFRLGAWLPALLFVFGLWFLLRGANLDVPFLSPLIYPEGAISCG